MNRIGPSILLGIALAVFVATAPTSTAQNNLPEDVRAMAKNDDERSREIIRAAIEFISLHLGNENPK
jgi:hypothetical protein